MVVASLARLIPSLLVLLLFGVALGSPQSAEAEYKKGLSFLSQRQFEEAAVHFSEVVRLVPHVKEGYLALGQCYESSGNQNMARETYKTAAKKFPNHIDFMRFLCRAAFQQQQTVEKNSFGIRDNLHPAILDTEYACTAMIELGGGDPVDSMILGTFYSTADKPELGVPYLLKAREASRNSETFGYHAELLRILAQGLFRDGRCTEAVEVSRELLEVDKSILAVCNLGHILSSCAPLSWEGVRAMTDCSMCSRDTGACRTAVPVPALCPQPNFQFCGPDWSLCKAPNVLFVHDVDLPSAGVYGSNDTLSLKPLRTPVPLAYNEKKLFAVGLKDVYLIGSGAQPISDCYIFSGSHNFNLKLPETFTSGIQTTVITEPTLNMVSQTHNNYYHFVAECLPRLFLGLKHLPGADELKILVPGENRFILEIVRLFQLEHRFIPYTGSNEHRYSFKELYFADWYQANQDEVHQIDAWAIFQPPKAGFLAVREAFFPLITRPQPEKPQILYVSRGDLKSSRHVNGEEGLLERLVAEFPDFEVVNFSGSKHSILDQATAFKQAAIIVGPHGAGLTNIMFCEAGTPVVYFPMEPNVDSNFGHMSSAVGLPFWVVPSVTSAFHGQYHLDEEQIADILATVKEAWRRKTQGEAQIPERSEL